MCVFAADVLHECVVLGPNEKVAFRPQSIDVLSPYRPCLSSVYKLSVYVRVCFAINVCVCVSVGINSLFTTQFRHSSVLSAVACFCSSSPLLFLFLRLPLLVLVHLRAYVARPSPSPCTDPWRRHRGGAGSAGGGTPAPGSAGRCFRGGSAPSRPRTSAGFRCSGTTIRTRRPEDGRPGGSRRSAAR